MTKITLNDFANLHISNMGESYIFVFDTESDMDSFINRNNDYELLCTLHSTYVSSVYLKPEIANATVMNFSATGRNTAGNGCNCRIGQISWGFRIIRFMTGCIDTDGLWNERLRSQ